MAPSRICLLLLLLLMTGPREVWASVSDSFKDCSLFMYMRVPPIGLRGKDLRKICQRYGDKPRYATLYDRSHRLPIYSAYIFKKSDGQKRVDTPWMYEPQLALENEDGNMKVLPPDEELDPLVEESQVVLEDFTDAVLYERSPLNPDLHQSDNEDKAATYTLTNVVPLVASFKEEYWIPFLETIRKRLNNFCRGTSYVVTGVTISGAMIRRKNTDRLAIPKYLWSAYCCPHFDRNSPYNVRYMFPSYAAYGLNELVGHSILEVPLKTLENFLKNQTNMDQNLALFHKDCVSENPLKRRRKK